MKYKSPLKKLVQFFKKSRDDWKEKAQTTKRILKSVKNRVRFLEDSKARLKAEVNSLKTQLLGLQRKKMEKNIPLKQVALKKTPQVVSL